MIGDLICDDWANTPECEFDGADCCNPNSDFSHCINCECLNWDNYTLSVSYTSHPPPFGPTCKIFCPKINISRNFQMYNIDCWQLVGVGDGICDDQANTLECNYDGGDCCMGIKGLYCTQCVCKDTYTGYPLLTTTPFNWHGWFKSLKKCQK